MLRLIAISEVREAKDGRKYFIATFRPGLGQRQVNRTFWQQFKRDAQGANTEEKYWERMSPEEAIDAIKGKESIEGAKITHTVEAYQIGDRMVSTYSTVIFPDETPEALFRAQNHPIVDETTGEIIDTRTPAQKAVLSTDKPAVTEEVKEKVEEEEKA